MAPNEIIGGHMPPCPLKFTPMRMAPSSSYRAKFKTNLKNLSLLHQRRSYNSISDPNANVVSLDSTSDDSAVFHCMTRV